MNRIERYSNWSYFDRLDGVDLKDGEMLLVRFPDGHETEVRCVVESRPFPILDMGHYYDSIDSRAYHEIQWHGVTTRIPIVGLEARRL